MKQMNTFFSNVEARRNSFSNILNSNLFNYKRLINLNYNTKLIDLL